MLSVHMTAEPRVTNYDRLERTVVNDPNIRPRDVRTFSVPFGETMVIRAWEPRDREVCCEIIANVLAEHGLDWEAKGADRDVIDVESAYRNGEFWVIEDLPTAYVVGTAAFYAVPARGFDVVEIRKMYLRPCVRGIGLGSFLLSALETRAAQLGFRTAIVETASVLAEACRLYRHSGYTPSKNIHTARCDVVLEKSLLPPGMVPPLPSNEPTHLEIVDLSRGWTVAPASRDAVAKHRLPFRAVAVLIETEGKVLVHRRSRRKATYPGRMVALVTGCVDCGETPLASAQRETLEEIGIDHLEFREPFNPFFSVGEDPHRQRILFHPYIASGIFSVDDVICDPDEIECGILMPRDQIHEEGVGGPLWAEFRAHGL